MAIEHLESRVLLHADPGGGSSLNEMTISFAPDGTDVAGQGSTMFSEFASLNVDDWQQAIVRAVETWARLASTDIRVVDDSGAGLGTNGMRQGDPRFGDVRIAAVPLPTDTVAMAIPLDAASAGTWAGDILFNANVDWTSVDELYAVALHEAGHVFGLDHSDAPDSPMFSGGATDATAPTDRDREILQQLVRELHAPAEDNKAEDNNAEDNKAEDNKAEDNKAEDSDDRDARRPAAGAARIEPLSPSLPRYVASGTIETAADIDLLQLAPTPAAGEDLKVLSLTVRSTDAGRLIPLVDVLTSDGRVLGAKVLANGNGLLVLQVKDVDPRDSYVIRIRAADAAAPAASGRYDVQAEFVRQARKLDKYFTSVLSDTANKQVQVFRVQSTSLAYFALSAARSVDHPSAVVWAVISDRSGKIVARIATRPGETYTNSAALLTPGDYRVEFGAASSDGMPIGELPFALHGQTVSWPAGPTILDPTRLPMLPATGTPQPTAQAPSPGLTVTQPIIFPAPGLLPMPAPSLMTFTPPANVTQWYWSTRI